MRQETRHPFELPIKYQIDENGMIHEDDMRNISEGGICIQSQVPLEIGSEISIKISICTPPFAADGVIVWCKPEGEVFEAGVQFDNVTAEFSCRMVEQISYIEQYRKDVEKLENRSLTPQEAALEWFQNYAFDEKEK